MIELGSVQLLSCVRLFVTPWTAPRQASLSITNSWSLLKPMSVESVMPSNHLIFCRPLLLLPSTFPSIRVFSNESVLKVRLIYSLKTMLQFKENNSHLYWHLGSLGPGQNFACVFRSNHKHLPSWETPWRKAVFPTPDWVQSQCTPSKMLVA